MMVNQDDKHISFNEEIQKGGEDKVASICSMAKEHYIVIISLDTPIHYNKL